MFSPVRPPCLFVRPFVRLDTSYYDAIQYDAMR